MVAMIRGSVLFSGSAQVTGKGKDSNLSFGGEHENSPDSVMGDGIPLARKLNLLTSSVCPTEAIK